MAQAKFSGMNGSGLSPNHFEIFLPSSYSLRRISSEYIDEGGKAVFGLLETEEFSRKEKYVFTQRTARQLLDQTTRLRLRSSHSRKVRPL